VGRGEEEDVRSSLAKSQEAGDMFAREWVVVNVVMDVERHLSDRLMELAWSVELINALVQYLDISLYTLIRSYYNHNLRCVELSS
jgi:hypothetical protein